MMCLTIPGFLQLTKCGILQWVNLSSATIPPPKDLRRVNQIYTSNQDLPSHVSNCKTWRDCKHFKFNMSKTKILISPEALILFHIPINDTTMKNLTLLLPPSSSSSPSWGLFSQMKANTLFLHHFLFCTSILETIKLYLATYLIVHMAISPS